MPEPSSSVSAPEVSGFALKLLVAVAIGMALFLVYELRFLVLLTFLGIIVAVFWSMITDTVLRVLPGWVPRPAALMLVVLVSLGLFGLFAALLLEPITEQFNAFVSQLPDIVRDVWMRLQPVIRRVPGLEDFNPASIDFAAIATRVFQSSLGLLGNVLYVLGAIVTTLFLAVFLALEPDRYIDGVVSLFPLRRQKAVRQLIADLGTTLRQ